VLAPGGLVLSTTPFVLGVHLPVADYTRFSRLGLIRLFRRFTPLECDVIEGAAVTLPTRRVLLDGPCGPRSDGSAARR